MHSRKVIKQLQSFNNVTNTTKANTNTTA